MNEETIAQDTSLPPVSVTPCPPAVLAVLFGTHWNKGENLIVIDYAICDEGPEASEPYFLNLTDGETERRIGLRVRPREDVYFTSMEGVGTDRPIGTPLPIYLDVPIISLAGGRLSHLVGKETTVSELVGQDHIIIVVWRTQIEQINSKYLTWWMDDLKNLTAPPAQLATAA
jgi:hypothetical protein